MGMSQWDPCRLSTGSNASKFNQYRAAELKHGRVAQHFIRFKFSGEMQARYGGNIDFEGVPSGFGAISAFPANVCFALLILTLGIVELRASDEGRAPGDFGDPLNLREKVASGITDDANLRTYELEHGRLAMLEVMGTLVAEYVTGYDAVEQWENAGAGAARLLATMSS